MFDFSKYKGIFLWGAVIVVAFVAYNILFVKKDATVSGPSILVVDKSSVSEEDRNVLQLLADMQSIRLDASVLQNKIFLSLQDFSIPLQDEPRGRPNPFAPVGDNAAAAVSISQPTSVPGVPGKGN